MEYGAFPFRRKTSTSDLSQNGQIPTSDSWVMSTNQKRSLWLIPSPLHQEEFILDLKMQVLTVTKLPCFAYIMNQGFPLEPPTSYYQRVVDIGYRDFDLDRQSLGLA